MSVHERNRAYINERLKEIIENMSNAVLQNLPEDVPLFLLNWLKEFSSEQMSYAQQDELKRLRFELRKVQEGLESSASESDSEEEDSIDELPQTQPSRGKGPRQSVSAEAFGSWNKKESFQPRRIFKDSVQTKSLREKLLKCFMFSTLDDKSLKIVIDSIEYRKYKTNDIVIQQGDDGQELFIIESGQLECTRTNNNNQTTFLRTYSPGELFGELSLLYNTPRAATIKAVTESECWVLDRGCFNHIVKDAAVQRRQMYEEFLGSVELLENMSSYERMQLADALLEREYKEDEYIIQEGEWGDVFYIILEGTAIATKTLEPGSPPVQVNNYWAGQYFGELSLLRGEPRAANVIATSDVKCVTLSKGAFKRMLGPLTDILQRNAVKYQNIIEELNNKR